MSATDRRTNEDELSRTNYRHLCRALHPMTRAELAAHQREWLADMERFVGTCVGHRAEWLDELVSALRRAVAG